MTPLPKVARSNPSDSGGCEMAVWIQFVFGPLILLIGGVLVKQFGVIRRENTEQHTAGQEKIGMLIDSHHNLTGKVDGLVDKLDTHINDDHGKRRKAS